MSTPYYYDGPHIYAAGRMRQAALRARRWSLDRMHEQGFGELTMTHYPMFRHGGADGLRPTEIAVQCGLSKQMVNDLLAQLESFGYLTRERDPEDGRGRIVRFTERGHAAYAAMMEATAATEAIWRDAVGEPAWNSFREVLDRVAMLDLDLAFEPAVLDAA